MKKDKQNGKNHHGVVSMVGFLLAVAGTIAALAGARNIGSTETVLSISSGLFTLFVGYVLVGAGSIVWAAGVGAGWDDVAEDKVPAALRIFGAIPVISGLITILCGLTTDVEATVSGINLPVNYYLLIFGAASFVIGAVCWLIGFLRSSVKTTILLRGGTRRAKFFKDYRSELKKISWFSKKETFKHSGVVIVVMLVLALVIGVLDLLFYKSLNEWLVNLVK